MKAYVIDYTIYIGPFSKEVIIDHFYDIVEILSKEFKKKGIDYSNVSLDIATIFTTHWEKYFIGLFTEHLDIDELTKTLLNALKLVGLTSLNYVKPITIEENLDPIEIYTDDFIEIKSKGIENDLKILDKKLSIYSGFERLIGFGVIKLIYWFDSYKEHSDLDFIITLKLDLSSFQQSLTELLSVINKIKEIEKDGEIYVPSLTAIEKPYDIDLNLIKILNRRFEKLLYGKGLSTREYLKILNEYLSVLQQFTYNLDSIILNQSKLDELKQPDDLYSLTTFLHRIVDINGFDHYAGNAYTTIEILTNILPRLFDQVGRVKDKKALEFIEEILRILNNSYLTIRTVKTSIETLNYEPYVYTGKEWTEIVEEFQSQITRSLTKIAEIIMKIPIRELIDYLKSRDRFYDYMAYPIIEKLILEKEKLLRYKRNEILNIIIKLVNNIYELRFLPSITIVYKKTSKISDLLKAYNDLFSKDYIERIDIEDLKNFIRYYENYLPKPFVEKAANRIYKSIVKDLNELLEKGDITEIIKKLDEEPHSVGDRLVDKLIWPYLKRKIDLLAQKDLEKAIEFIDNVLQHRSFVFAFRDTPKGRLKNKLIGKKLALIRKKNKTMSRSRT